MSNIDKANKLFNEICAFPELYSRKKYAISVKEFEAKKVTRDLKEFASLIFESIPNEVTEGFIIKASRGMTYMPRIVWLAFLPERTKVSSHMSVAICFGKSGEGIVTGLMESRGIRQLLTSTTNRTNQPHPHACRCRR